MNCIKLWLNQWHRTNDTEFLTFLLGLVKTRIDFSTVDGWKWDTSHLAAVFNFHSNKSCHYISKYIHTYIHTYILAFSHITMSFYFIFLTDLIFKWYDIWKIMEKFWDAHVVTVQFLSFTHLINCFVCVCAHVCEAHHIYS